jgi:hypothetical protein
MKILVTVSDVDLGAEVEQTYRQTGEEDYTPVPVTLADLVAERIAEDVRKDDRYDRLRERVLKIRDEQIREQVAPLVAAALAAPIQRTNEYGTPQGPAVTMTELITTQVHRYLTNTGYDRETPVQKLVKEAVGRQFQAELGEVIKAEKDKVVAAVRAKAAELIAESVRQGVGR